MRFLGRALGGLVLLSITFALLAIAGASLFGAIERRVNAEMPDREPNEQVFAANVVEIAPSRITPVLTSFGEVRSRRNSEVRASVSGRVEALGPGVEEGGAVAEGDLILRIDPAEAETALALADTDVADAEAELREARDAVGLAQDDLANAEAQVALRDRALERQRDLATRGIGSEAAVETAELAEVAAEQSVLSRRQALAEARARVATAETALARQRIARDEAARAVTDTEVRAAFDGVLSDLVAVRGGLVGQNERLADLIDPDALEIAFRVSTPEYARLLDAEGRLAARDVAVMLEVGGFAIETPARITRESAAVGEAETGRQLFARLERPAGFRPGDFARVMVEEPPLDDVARLPADAVGADGTVLVLGAEDRLQLGEVELLRRQGDEVLVRAEGLAGREVVAERSPLLGQGIRVRPHRQAMPDEESAAAGGDMLELDAARRARLVAFVEADEEMAESARERVLAQLREDRVPAQVVARIEGRLGG
ncbi:biotin/lipoyl-binding protein [Palleronia aestuarii]|uniref:Biotin/lipoyl-binding protein n=1 Tax=Palleronia aestuarii TaxID=568105 RepID=A0A2W7P834_9RHOB|nr:HlyD family efflux transporter periplasmic adaptor subunit [Palleronia aestuarii]PZX19562.1 biotin/lipoyl-binding protein [Palleronia aestuarii]